ncbi:MAG: hypothetical protein SFW65_02390 [Alphaproteobacteria bacterium]|nr:hypothetical protein [Alphaproteobacteria bacterium]
MLSSVNHSAASGDLAVQHDFLTALERVFEFAEAQHEGETRHRPNSDGSPRDYLCHTLEVAFIAAHYEMVMRKKCEDNFDDRFVVQQLIRVVSNTAHNTKDQLKHKLRRVVKRLDQSQMREIVGLICHDVIERAYKRDLQPGQVRTAAEKEAIAKPLLAEIAKLFPGADDVVFRLTDPSEVMSKQMKSAAQQQRALDDPLYAKLKSIDGLANTNDQASIPDDARGRDDMLRKLGDMYNVVEAGCAYRPSLRHIHMAYLIIHQRTVNRLNAA